MASYNSQKVRLYFIEKCIKWNDVHFDLLKQEHLTEDYLKINPNGLVPTLVDDKKIIYNSTDIMKYVSEIYAIDNHHSSELSEKIYRFSKSDERLHDPFIRTLSFSSLWMKKSKSPEEIKRILAMAAMHPNKARGAFLQKAVLGQFTKEEVDSAREAVIHRLNEIESMLESSKSSFIFSDHYTMADAVVTVFLCRISRLSFYDDIERRDLILNYYTAMKNRPSFDKTPVY